MCISALTLAVLAPLNSPEPPVSFVLASDAKPAAAIVIAHGAPTTVRFAAAELQANVRRITGATLPIIEDGQSTKGRRIYVGESEATRKRGLRSTSFGPQERLVEVTADRIVLMGRDGVTAGPGGTRWPGRRRGRFGRALEFDGRQTVATVPDFHFPSAEGTLEVWAFVTPDTPERDGTILRVDGESPWTYHILQQPGGTRTMEYRLYDGTTVTSVRSGEMDPGWHHVVATHSLSAKTAELFVNGISQGTTGFGHTACAGSTLGIGGMPPAMAGSSSVDNPFRGLIDEVRILQGVRKPRVIPSGPHRLDADTLLLLHADEKDGPPLDATGRAESAPLPDFFGDNGTLYAVYDFLETQCGVRWYVPGEIGVVAERRASLAIGPTRFERSPSMAYRWITPTALFLPTPADRVSSRDADLWRLRNRTGGLPYNANHSFSGYYDRFLKLHPEWFAQGYTGQPPQMCYTNPEFIAKVVQDARDYFDGKGTSPGAAALGDYFALVPMDNTSWCKCERCQALQNRTEESNLQFNNGKASDYVWGFVNAVAREVRKTHPKRWIAALAYSDYAYAPREPIEPNVAVQLCLHVRNWFCPSMEANDLKVLRAFTADRRRPVYLWLYYNFPALQAQYDGYRTFPSFFASTLLRQMPMYRQAGIRGMFIEHSSEFGQSHMGDVPDLWLTLKLAENASLDGMDLYAGFFREFYGAAAQPMRKAYELIEATYGTPSNYPDAVRQSRGHQHQTRELAWRYLGTPERIAQIGRHVEEARGAARTAAEKARVSLFELGIWLPMVEGAAAWAREHGAPY